MTTCVSTEREKELMKVRSFFKSKLLRCLEDRVPLRNHTWLTIMALFESNELI